MKFKTIKFIALSMSMVMFFPLTSESSNVIQAKANYKQVTIKNDVGEDVTVIIDEKANSVTSEDI